jgi:chemotaxis response regulator CheB
MDDLETSSVKKFNINGNTKAKIKIYIISAHLMFSYGLKSLLGNEASLEVIGQETNIERGVKKIKEVRPDVVILDTEGLPYTSLQELMRILKAIPDVRVITLNLHNNNIYTHRARRQVVKGIEDLIGTIKEDIGRNSHHLNGHYLDGYSRNGTPSNGYREMLPDGNGGG